MNIYIYIYIHLYVWIVGVVFSCAAWHFGQVYILRSKGCSLLRTSVIRRMFADSSKRNMIFDSKTKLKSGDLCSSVSPNQRK